MKTNMGDVITIVLGIRDILVWMTPFFSEFKAAKTFFLKYFFSHYLQSLIRCFKDKFCVKILFCKHYLSPLNTFMRIGNDPGTDPDL
jgi:hypothetical protein